MNNLLTALKVFRRAVKSVPAYRSLVRKLGINPSRVTTAKAYAMLPVTDKESYIKANTRRELTEVDASIPQIYASSGSSGRPTFWLSHEPYEEVGGELHRIIFDRVFNISKNERTLVVICFSLGLWIAGLYTMLACRYLARKGYRVTVVTPGLEKENTFTVLRDLAPEYDTVVIAGYPPLVMDILTEAKRKGIRLGKSIKILTAGDKFTETWRDAVLSDLALTDPSAVLNLYGSADATVLGFETPATIALRRLATRDANLYRALFGEERILPAIFQYDPQHLYLEEVNGELVITANTAIPLVRYNIHDRVTIKTQQEMLALLKPLAVVDSKLLKLVSLWKYPFVIVCGRTDVAVTYYALNVYPENIKLGLEKRSFAQTLTRSFLIYTTENRKARREELHIIIELTPSLTVDTRHADEIRSSIVNNLIASNSEYRKLHATFGEKVLPSISFAPFGTLKAPAKTKAVAHVWGKKPRIVQ